MFSCPNGLLFDSNNGRCDIPEKVPSCSDKVSRDNYAGSSRVKTQGTWYEANHENNKQEPLPPLETIRGEEKSVPPQEARIPDRRDVIFRQGPGVPSYDGMVSSPMYERGQIYQPTSSRRNIDVRLPLNPNESVDSLGNINIYLHIPPLAAEDRKKISGESLPLAPTANPENGLTELVMLTGLRLRLFLKKITKLN